MRKEEIVIVSGLPRSGTSLMMHILKAAGFPLLTDGQRPPDVHNPQGYFEFAAAKSLANNNVSWLAAAQGKAVKIISYLLPYLPSSYPYRILFMNRDLHEVIRSQNKMLAEANKPLGKLSITQLEERFAKHLQEMHSWLRQQANIDFIDINYHKLVNEPREELERIWRFLSLNTSWEGALSVVDPALYRTRKNSTRD